MDHKFTEEEVVTSYNHWLWTRQRLLQASGNESERMNWKIWCK